MQQLVAVVGVILRGDRVLAMRRAAHKPGAGLWEGVSGRVAPGEDPLEAVAREIVEETQLRVLVEARPVDCYAARRGEEPMTVIVFRAKHDAGEVVLNDEHDAFDWLPLEELEPLPIPERLRLAMARCCQG